MGRKGKALAAAFSFTAMLLGASLAVSASFPSQAIRVVVGTGPAAPPDIISRIIATELGESEGWKVIVENKTGAMQTLAGNDVARSSADGHSLWATSMPATAAPALMRKLSIDLRKDFEPVVALAKSYNVLVVHPSVKANSFAELVQLLKSEPNKINYASGGNGTPAHLVAELFKLETATTAAHVPYQNPGSMYGDLLSGTTQFSFVTSLPVVEHIKAGKLRALAVTSDRRLAALPDVPTVAELGYPALVLEAWSGLLAKAGTSKESIMAINAAVNRALKKPSVISALAKVGADPMGGSPEDFAKLYESQITHWGDVVKRAGIKIE